jgi:hypothetical protein
MSRNEEDDITMTSTQATPIQKDPTHSTQGVTQELTNRANAGITLTIQNTSLTALTAPKALILRDWATAAAARGDAKDTQHAPARSPLNKYTTTSEMPRVQDAFPAAAIANIDLTLLDEWFSYKGQKLLIIPFEDKARDLDLKHDIGEKILTMVEEITATQKATIGPPVPKSEVTKLRQMPITFIAYYLTHSKYNTLLSCHVWSSEAITFRVLLTDLPCPDFLFTLCGYITLDQNHIYTMVSKVWNDKETKNFITCEVNSTHTENKKLTEETLIHLIKSLKVTHLKIKSQGNSLTPHFNIYTNGKATTDEELWANLRTYLASRVYTLLLQGTGKVIKAPFNCGACHGVDHPRGLCPFLSIKGWNGPTYYAEDDPRYRG